MPGERSPIISTDLERKALEFALSEDGEVESSEDGEVESHELLGAIKQRGQLSYEAVMSKFEDF